MNINKNSQTILYLFPCMNGVLLYQIQDIHSVIMNNTLSSIMKGSPGDTYSETMDRNSKVKKWLQMFPALNVSRPSVLRRSAVLRVISLYSTT